MCCSSAAAKSPMAEYVKSHSPQELWKAGLKPPDPLKPDDPARSDPSGSGTLPVKAAAAPGTGLLLDATA